MKTHVFFSIYINKIFEQIVFKNSEKMVNQEFENLTNLVVENKRI